MSKPLTIAIVRAELHDEITGARTFEEEVLMAALLLPSPHRLVIYPATSRIKKAVEELGLGGKVSFVHQLREPKLPRRMWRRAKRSALRRARPLPHAELSEALRKAGADCAWMLGASLVPLDLPYVATIWDLQHRVQPWFPEVSHGGEWRKREQLYQEYVRRAAVILVGTSVGGAEVREAYGNASGAINVLPMPTPAFAIEAGLRPRGTRPVDLPYKYLLYPAQFWPHKNHVTAVRVIAALRDEPNPPSLICIGADGGTMAHVLSEAKERGIADRVQAPGFVDRKRLVSLYQHAEALLYPSLFGPDNLPPLEAMALGCPVIAARVAGADEQIGDAGVLVDGMNVRGFADAVVSLRDDEFMRDAMVDRGRLRARGWTAQQYVGSVLSLIESRIRSVRELWK